MKAACCRFCMAFVCWRNAFSELAASSCCRGRNQRTRTEDLYGAEGWHVVDGTAQGKEGGKEGEDRVRFCELESIIII